MIPMPCMHSQEGVATDPTLELNILDGIRRAFYRVNNTLLSYNISL